MTPSKIFNNIKKDRYYLLNSYLIDLSMMIVIIFILIKTKWSIDLNYTFIPSLIIFLLAIINGLFVSSLLHNSSHSNVPTKIFNRVVGEYCGYWVLYGFTNFCLVHILHHQHSDDELDPVNPKGMTFFVFLSAPMRYMINTTKKYLFQIHGKHNGYNNILQLQVVVFHINIALRLLIWYLILGNSLFLLFYLPSFITIVSVFAHINYVCHRDHEDGSVEIVNLNHNSYYKIVNFFTMGGYFHKNHHINMNLFNPIFLKVKSETKTYLSSPTLIYLPPTANERYFYSGPKFSRYLNINNVWGEGERNRMLVKSKYLKVII